MRWMPESGERATCTTYTLRISRRGALIEPQAILYISSDRCGCVAPISRKGIPRPYIILSNYISNHEISRNIDVYNNDAYQVRVSNNVGCVTSAVQQYAIRVTLFMSQNLRCARVVSFFWQRACRSFFIRLILCCWLWSILLANLAFTPACGFDHACYLHDNVLLLLMMAVRTRLRYLIHSVYRVLRHQLFAYFIFQISTFIQCWTNILKLRAS